MTSDVVQLHRLKWFAGQALALLSLWTVAALDMAQGVVLGIVFLVTFVVTVAPRLPGMIPVFLRRLATPVLILVFIVDLVTSGQDLIPPLIRLLMALLLLRLVIPRGNREDLQLILLAMFLAVVSGVFTLSMLFALQAFLFSILSIGILYLVNLLESTEEKQTSEKIWDTFNWREFIVFVRHSLSGGLFRSLAILLVLLVATTGILFVSIPRVYLDQAIPFLRLQQQGMSGFNDTVRFGEVTRIQQDDGVALRIDVPGLSSIPAEPYWRMLILDRYDRGSFANSLFLTSRGTRMLPQVNRLSPYPSRWFAGAENSPETWTFYMEGGVSRYLPILGPFREMAFQGRQPLQANPGLMVFRIPEATTSVFSFQIEDFLVDRFLPAGKDDVPLTTGEVPSGRSALNRYPYTTLSLPMQVEERAYLEEVAGSITEGIEDPIEKAERIMAYLRGRHSYTLSPGSFGEGDPVVQWIQEERDGHCELFAGAFTLLGRAAGIPTRMVVGFSGGSWNSYEDYFVVRNRNAHAWAEVFDGTNWVRFDPTPGGWNASGFTAAAVGETGFFQEADFQAWIDSLRVMWYRRVINFDESTQQEMVSGISALVKEMGVVLKDWVSGSWRFVSNWAKEFGVALRESVVAWAVLLGVTLLVVFLAWFLSFGPGAKWLRYRPGRGLAPLRQKAGREIKRLERSKTEDVFGIKMKLMERLMEVRFGRSPETNAAIRLFREVRSFVRGKEAKW
ncbi:MAG: DUF3488 and transglutaminase-like domain-containing protein [Verrucomicrobiota bacterium]